MKKIAIENILQKFSTKKNNISTSAKTNLNGKVILITGAAGSIGSAIARQISIFNIKSLLLCDIAESPLYEISMEIEDDYPHIRYKSLITDIRNYNLVKQLFEAYKPDIIYHAAAYKHVPLMEQYPCEAILTNILGSKNIADLALEYHTEIFVMISTDKAINPGNVMGASKRIAEIYIQTLVKKSKESNNTGTRFITTRFGNVLGSSGSVIVRFQQQIKKRGPLTVTHPDATRYFITIQEACYLVLEASSLGKGGEIFIFDIGNPIKIKDIAEEMIRSFGFEPYKDIDIIFTGLRPGEKLHEELSHNQEILQSTSNDKIKISAVKKYNYDIDIALSLLLTKAQTYCSSYEIVKQMKNIVPEFISCNSEFAKLDKNMQKFTYE